MNDPVFLVLLLEQGDCSPGDHTEDFVFLANNMHYPDNTTREQLSGDGPRESLAAFIEWVLVSCKSHLTVDMADSDTSHTQDPEASQLPPCNAELSEPTADREPEPAAVIEPSGATELTIIPEPEPQISDKVREPTAQARVDTAVEIVGALERPTHGTTAGGEHKPDLGNLIDFHSDIFVLQPSPELYAWENIPPNLHLPPPLLDLFLHHLHWISSATLLTLISPSVAWARRWSADPQLCWHWVWRIPRLRLSPATQWLHHGFQLPCLHRSPSVLQLHRAPLSLQLRQSSPYLHLGTALLWLRLVPSSLWLHWAPSPAQSTPRSPPAPPWPSGSSTSPWLFGSLSPPLAPLPPVLPPLVNSMESAPTRPPWLLSPSAPPWVTIVTVAWVPPVSSCSKPLMSPSCLLPPSDPPWTLLVVLLPGVCPLPEPPPVISACLSASPSPSPVTIPHPLLYPSPKSPSIPPFVSTMWGHAWEGGELSQPTGLKFCLLPVFPSCLPIFGSVLVLLSALSNY